MTTPLRPPPTVSPGDRVAIVSPSGGLAEALPLPYELGLTRLREQLGLVSVEYPTTRRLVTSPAERAADLHAAFADPEIAAVLASIGGDDQITVLPHLDPELMRAQPKPFLGYSDNTNLLHSRWRLGLSSWHGGSVMAQLGRPGAMHPTTLQTLRWALFGGGRQELVAPTEFTDSGDDWADAETFARQPLLRPAEPWQWHGPARVVSGRTWGGCLEILDLQLRAHRWMGEVEQYAGCVLLLETSEEQPDETYVYRVLLGMGERGLLGQFSAALVARPRAGGIFGPGPSLAERAAYTSSQRDAVLRAFAAYAPSAVVVTGVDFGHTDPQLVIPYGGTVTVDGEHRRLWADYGRLPPAGYAGPPPQDDVPAAPDA